MADYCASSTSSDGLPSPTCKSWTAVSRDLTGEKAGKLEQLLSVLGSMSTSVVARAALESASWDMDQAVTMILDDAVPAGRIASVQRRVDVACGLQDDVETSAADDESDYENEEEDDDRQQPSGLRHAAPQTQESLLIDQQKDAERRTAELVARQQEQTAREVEEAARQAEELRQANLRMKLERLESASVDAKHPQRRQLVVRVPSRRRIVRNFLASDMVSLVYDWVDVMCVDEEFTKQGYALVSQVLGQLRREFAHQDVSLQEAGLDHQTMLFIVASDWTWGPMYSVASLGWPVVVRTTTIH